jgi:hypothetical protein
VPPLGRITVGFLVVLVDLRFNGLDIVPDLAGWALVLVGLSSLVGRSGWFQLASAAAAMELVASVFELLQPATGLAALVDAVAGPAVVLGVCSGVMATVANPGVRRTADVIRWLSVVLGLMDLAFRSAAVDGQQDLGGPAALAVVLFVVVALGVLVWFLVFCWRERQRPELV